MKLISNSQVTNIDWRTNLLRNNNQSFKYLNFKYYLPLSYFYLKISETERVDG